MALSFKALFSARLQQNLQLIRPLCVYNKELVKPQSGDLLLQNLKNASNTRAVLDLVDDHNRIMNNKHVIQAMRSLFLLQKIGNTNYSTKEILGHPNFAKLCKRLKYQAGSIELNETIEALKVVSYVGVPSNSTIVQVLLQLIRHNINHLTLQHITFMDFLLTQFKSSPLVDALKIALPLVFEIHLPIKMERDNVTRLTDYLYYCSRHQLGLESIDLIVNALLKTPEFEPKEAKSIVWSICDMDYNDSVKPLLKKALDSMVIHLYEFNYNDLETTLSKLISRYTKRSNYFYDETFFDSCANYLIDHDLGYKHSVYLLRKFARIVRLILQFAKSHSNNFLLDYMARKIKENPDYISQGELVDIYSIVVSVALTEFRPAHWDFIKDLIVTSNSLIQTDRKEIIWIKFGAALCVLDIYKVDILSRCLDEQFLETIFKNKFFSDFENYTAIWQSIKHFKPELNCLLPQKLKPEDLVDRYYDLLEFPLERALNKALGGDKYVKTNLFSREGHQIDHVVVFRKGGFPVAMNYSEDLRFIEDIEIPADTQLVIIKCLRPVNYTLNNRRLKGIIDVAFKTLEINGYQVVPICEEVWMNLPDFEKIPYLMQAINEKIDSDFTISQSVV